jgi:hypothetical protein
VHNEGRIEATPFRATSACPRLPIPPAVLYHGANPRSWLLLLPLLQIDVLLVDGQYYGFSGCHRYEAHQRLGLPTIKCRVRKANKQVLKMHMM